jgi:hypothetical protein
MKSEQRAITRLPLRELWDERGVIENARCGNTIDRQAIADLLRLGPVQFVIADVGHPPTWVAVKQCFEFWRCEVKMHLADPANDGFSLDAFPERYAYIARQWQVANRQPIIVLEKHH